MGIVIWPLFFLLAGVLFGAVGGRPGWAWLGVPVVLGVLDLLVEGVDLYSVVMILVCTALAALGVAFGISVQRQKGTTPGARAA